MNMQKLRSGLSRVSKEIINTAKANAPELITFGVCLLGLVVVAKTVNVTRGYSTSLGGSSKVFTPDPIEIVNACRGGQATIIMDSEALPGIVGNAEDLCFKIAENHYVLALVEACKGAGADACTVEA